MAPPKVSYSQPVDFTTGQPASINEARARAIDDTAFGRSLVERHGKRLDVRTLINAALSTRFSVGNLDQGALEAWGAVNEAVRQRSGEVANGTWAPLSLFRDLTVGSATAGGHTVGEKIAVGQAAGSLLPQSAVLNAGATVMSGLRGGEFMVPVCDLAGDGSDAWIDPETGEGPERSMTFSAVSLPLRTVSAFVDVSRQMLLQSSLDLNGMVFGELGRQLGRAIDYAAINGTGSSHQPAGILLNSGITTLEAGTDGAAPTWAHITEAAYRLDLVHSGARAWLMSPALAKKLRVTSRVSGQPGFILEGSDLLGYPVRVSPSVPADLTKGSGTDLSALLHMDPSEVLIGFWGGASAVDLMINPFSFATEGRVRLIARCDVGIAVRRPTAVIAYKDLASA